MTEWIGFAGILLGILLVILLLLSGPLNRRSLNKVLNGWKEVAEGWEKSSNAWSSASEQWRDACEQWRKYAEMLERKCGISSGSNARSMSLSEARESALRVLKDSEDRLGQERVAEAERLQGE